MRREPHLRAALSLACLLLAAACGDDSNPTGSEISEAGAGTADAGGSQTDAAPANDASGADSGAQTTTDAGSSNMDGSARDNDAAPSTMSDAGALGDAGTSGDAGTTADTGTTSDAGTTGDGGTGGTGAFAVTSPAFENVMGCSKDTPSLCKVFPEENVSYMKDAASATENISPELSWTGVPAGTKSFAVVLQDLTNGLAHWVLWNVRGTATKLDKNVAKNSAMPPAPVGSQQCNASFAAGNGYIGPGSRCNVYEFVVYALARPMFSPTPATDAGQVRTQLQALGADILATASLRARANHMMMCTN